MAEDVLCVKFRSVPISLLWYSCFLDMIASQENQVLFLLFFEWNNCYFYLITKKLLWKSKRNKCRTCKTKTKQNKKYSFTHCWSVFYTNINKLRVIWTIMFLN